MTGTWCDATPRSECTYSPQPAGQQAPSHALEGSSYRQTNSTSKPCQAGLWVPCRLLATKMPSKQARKPSKQGDAHAQCVLCSGPGLRHKPKLPESHTAHGNHGADILLLVPVHGVAHVDCSLELRRCEVIQVQGGANTNSHPTCTGSCPCPKRTRSGPGR